MCEVSGQILSPLVRKNAHHVNNSKDFASEIKSFQVENDEEVRSFDVTALFTSVPVDEALVVIRDKLNTDTTLSDRTSLTTDDIIMLLRLCLKCTYFVFQGDYYLQIHGAAMGSPVSPIVCNLYMEDYEESALATAPYPPRIWKRYADDTITVNKREYSQDNCDHHNLVDPEHIKWTSEAEHGVDSDDEGKEEGTGSELKGETAIAFLDTLVVRQADGSVRTNVYRKDTHTDQYLKFESNHALEHEKSVVRTLMYRANCIVSDEKEREEEIDHIKAALTMNDYPAWMLVKENGERKKNLRETQGRDEAFSTSEKGRIPLKIPYIRGLSEQVRRLYKNYNIPSYYKPFNTLRQQLVRPKDPVPKERVVGPIYHVSSEDCGRDYIGETKRSFKARFDEHKRPSSVNSEVSRHIHQENPGHSVSLTGSRILGVEQGWFQRGVKEAIFIHAMKPSLNRGGGRFNLSPIWHNIVGERIGKGARAQSS